MIRNLWTNSIMFLCVFICNTIKVNHFWIVLLYHTLNLFYLLNHCLFHMHLFLLIDCILLSWFELKAILLIFSGKTLCFSLVNLCLSLILIDWIFLILYDFLKDYSNYDNFFSKLFTFLKLICFETMFIISKFKFSLYENLFVPFISMTVAC